LGKQTNWTFGKTRGIFFSPLSLLVSVVLFSCSRYSPAKSICPSPLRKTTSYALGPSADRMCASSRSSPAPVPPCPPTVVDSVDPVGPRSTAAEPSSLFFFPHYFSAVPPSTLISVLTVYGLRRRVTLWFSNGRPVCSGSTLQLYTVQPCGENSVQIRFFCPWCWGVFLELILACFVPLLGFYQTQVLDHKSSPLPACSCAHPLVSSSPSRQELKKVSFLGNLFLRTCSPA
jgi:hypothetical protein